MFNRPLVPLLAIVLLALLAACAERAPEAPRLTLTPVSFAALPGWEEDDPAPALAAFGRSCRALLNRPAGAALEPQALGGTAGDWRAPCEAALAVGADADGARARAFFERFFDPFALGDGADREGLFTGYYEPELNGAREPGGRYSVPLYALPADLVSVDLGLFRSELAGTRIAGRLEGQRLVPYEPRAAIEAGALAGRARPLVWVDDALDAFFLHIQGSGRVRFDDGSTERIGYAASNGHVYVAIGRALVERGALKLEEVSMQSIRAWLAAHPEEAGAVMALNPSYVFFRWLGGDGGEPGPQGAMGVALTPERSLAVDRRYVPLGAPVWIESEAPGGAEGEASLPLRRLMVAQDTGGAITGPVRGDVFWGAGEAAAWRAGQMRSPGRAYLLLPKELGPRALDALAAAPTP